MGVYANTRVGIALSCQGVAEEVSVLCSLIFGGPRELKRERSRLRNETNSPNAVDTRTESYQSRKRLVKEVI